MNETIEVYLDLLETGYFEVGEALKGLADKNVWKRPAGTLLAVGELAAHIAYGEAGHLVCEAVKEGRPDLSTCRVNSRLIDVQFAYYPRNLARPPSGECLAMTAAEVHAELLRVHKEVVADIWVRNPGMNDVTPGYPPEFTFGERLKYLTFHIAYHTGQIYLARHLLGEQTPDN